MSQRQCRYVPLGAQPLVLVLAQVRFSALPMSKYTPAIQDELRRQQFPLFTPGNLQQWRVTPTGVVVEPVERWEFRTRDERWSINLLNDALALQTTDYTRFEGFAEILTKVLDPVFRITEHEAFGVAHRVGLRYVDVVRLRSPEEDFRRYLRPGLHGITSGLFLPQSQRLFVESVGQSSVGEGVGTTVVRITQNDQGFSLPPDLAGGAPQHEERARAGELVTLIDMDHFIEGSFDARTAWLVEQAYLLHDLHIETFHNEVVTEEAVEAWRTP